MPEVRLFVPNLLARGEDVWTLEGRLCLALNNWIPVRMTVLRFRHRRTGAPSLLLYSVLPLSGAIVEQINALGTVTYILAPSSMHSLWASSVQSTWFPHAQLLAPPALAQKLPQVPWTKLVASPHGAPADWPMEQLEYKLLPDLDELVVFHKASRTLIVTDTAFNMRNTACGTEDLPLPPFHESWLLRLYGGVLAGCPRCSLTYPFRWIISDPATLLQNLTEVVRDWDFDQLIMAHGDVVTAGGKQALAAGTVAFLRQLVADREEKATRGGRNAVLAYIGVAAAVAVLAALAVRHSSFLKQG